MTVEAYVPGEHHRTVRESFRRSPSVRRWLLALSGCAVMALSGVGLAGYLDLSSASAADSPAATAQPPGGAFRFAGG